MTLLRFCSSVMVREESKARERGPEGEPRDRGPLGMACGWVGVALRSSGRGFGFVPGKDGLTWASEMDVLEKLASAKLPAAFLLGERMRPFQGFLRLRGEQALASPARSYSA